MNEEKPDPKEMFLLARMIQDQNKKTNELGEVILEIARLIDKCIFCIAIRYDTQPDFVDLIIQHFKDKHLVVEE